MPEFGKQTTTVERQYKVGADTLIKALKSIGYDLEGEVQLFNGRTLVTDETPLVIHCRIVTTEDLPEPEQKKA